MPNFDISKYVNMSPQDVRSRIRSGEIRIPTAGMCAGFAQANLAVLPADYAEDFRRFCKLNPFPCPVLEIVEGTPLTHEMADKANILTDIPEYFIYRNGKFTI